LLPLDPSNFIGIWCAPCGGFLFFNLIFRPDGVGVAEAGNCVLTDALVFDWRLDREELLISGREAIELNEPQDGVTHAPWTTRARVGVKFDAVALDNGERRRTLILLSPFHDDFPLEYLAGNPEYDVFGEPDFSWVGRLGRGN
jgi:hypothetical protein